MIDDKNQPLPDLKEMGEIPKPQNDPHPPIIIPKEMQRDEELYEDVHDRRRRAVMREKLTGITMLFFVGLIILVIALVTSFNRSIVANPNKTIPAETVLPVPAEATIPAVVPSIPTTVDTTNTVNDPAVAPPAPVDNNTVNTAPIDSMAIPTESPAPVPADTSTSPTGNSPTEPTAPAGDSLTFPSQVIPPSPNVPIEDLPSEQAPTPGTNPEVN